MIEILAIINWYLKIAVSNIVYVLTSILLTLTSTLTHFSLYQNSMVISSKDSMVISSKDSMVISSKDCALIKVLCQEKGYRSKKLFAEFPNKALTMTSLKCLLRKIDASGLIDWKRGSRWKHAVRTAEKVRVVEEISMSQETAPGSHSSLQIAREVGISKTLVHNIICRDLKLKCLRKTSK